MLVPSCTHYHCYAPVSPSLIRMSPKDAECPPLWLARKSRLGRSTSHCPGAEKFFKEHYSRRSKFLHAGAIVHSLPLLRSSQPLLDPHAPEGCGVPSVVAPPDQSLA